MGFTAIWYAGNYNQLLTGLIADDMAALDAAREMETALANQKGYVTYYFLDGDRKWLDQLAIHRRSFESWADRSYEHLKTQESRQMLDTIRRNYENYIRAKDQVIELYAVGDRNAGELLHREVRRSFFELSDLCKKYKAIQEEIIRNEIADSQRKARQITVTVIALMGINFLLSVLLALIFIRQVLIPIRRLSVKAAVLDESSATGDDVHLLSKRVHGILEEMDRTRTQLKQSKALLMNSEKMALVGKLATEVAHSIRNPMTSINMRLFSLRRSLELSAVQNEDFEVVTEEMRRLDHIVRNFLEFSRPHKLKKQKINISDVIDMTIDLLSYRLDLHSVKVHRKREKNLPRIDGDPELLKEVFVNLIVNACEAMETGGEISISEEEALAELMGRAVLVKISDNGPGMTDEVKARALEPFETTKPDGTGLGLFIAVRIIEGHGGKLELDSTPGKGTTFIITLPPAEEDAP
jgi:signal transduction histidine kinase